MIDYTIIFVYLNLLGSPRWAERDGPILPALPGLPFVPHAAHSTRKVENHATLETAHTNHLSPLTTTLFRPGRDLRTQAQQTTYSSTSLTAAYTTCKTRRPTHKHREPGTLTSPPCYQTPQDDYKKRTIVFVYAYLHTSTHIHIYIYVYTDIK